jgi:hypothetical protein
MMLNLDGQLRMTGTDLNDLLRQVDELNSENTSSQGTRYVLSTLQNHMRTLEAIKGTTGGLFCAIWIIVLFLLDEMERQMTGIAQEVGSNTSKLSTSRRPY